MPTNPSMLALYYSVLVQALLLEVYWVGRPSIFILRSRVKTFPGRRALVRLLCTTHEEEE